MAKLLNIVVNGKKYMADSVAELRVVLESEMAKIEETIKQIGGTGEDVLKKLLEEKKAAIREWDAKIKMAKNGTKITKAKEELQKALEKLK